MLDDWSYSRTVGGMNPTSAMAFLLYVRTICKTRDLLAATYTICPVLPTTIMPATGLQHESQGWHATRIPNDEQTNIYLEIHKPADMLLQNTLVPLCILQQSLLTAIVVAALVIPNTVIVNSKFESPSLNGRDTEDD